MWCLIKGFPWFITSGTKQTLECLDVNKKETNNSRTLCCGGGQFVEVQRVVW